MVHIDESLGVGDIFFVHRWHDVDAILRDGETFSSSINAITMGPTMGEAIILAKDGQEHRRYRDLVAKAFRASALERWGAELISPTIDALIDRIAPVGRAEPLSRRDPSAAHRSGGAAPDICGDPRKGHVENVSEYETDVDTFMRQVVLPDCPQPHFALAHSMGGAALLRVAHSGKRWFERTVLVSPMIDFPHGRAAWPLRVLVRALRLAGFGAHCIPGSTADRVRMAGFAVGQRLQLQFQLRHGRWIQ